MLQGKKCKAIVNNMSPRRNNFADDDSYGSCGRGAGTCFICLGTFILIFSAIRIVGPGLKGMDMDETTCNVTRIDIGADDSFSCDCGGFCSGTAPCVKIYVHIEAEGETAEDQMVHTTLTSLHHFSQCSWDNRECGSRHFENNIASAENWVEENYDEGEAYTCWYDPDNPGDVVFEREFDVRKIVNALLWPILFFFIGCCLLCVNSKGIRQCGGACCVAIVLPFWCLFYEGPRRMYKAMQRKCGCGGTDVFDDQSTDGAEAGCCESLCCPRSLRVHMVFSQGAIFPTDNNSTRDTVLQGQVTQHRTDVPPAYDDALRDTLVPSPVELQHLGGVQAFGAVSHRVQTTETAMDAGTLGDTSVLPPSSLVTNTELPPPDDLPPAYEQVAGANADAHANVEEPIMLRAASVADNESMSIVAGGQAAMHDAAPNYSTE
eukprot:m.50424 g.50424  ORF g.50424 m.50424 type:complete len:433 (-) comp15374_c1_seq5:654-1952(-)